MKKESFVKILDSIDKYWELRDRKQEAIKQFYEDNVNEGFIDFMDNGWTPEVEEMIDSIIDALKIEMNDKDEWIDYFIFELDFGRDWKPDSVTDKGKSVDMSSAGALYDYLYKLESPLSRADVIEILDHYSK